MHRGGRVRGGVYQRSKLTAAVSAGAEYAFLAAQANLSATTLLQNTTAIVQSASSLGLPANNIKVVLNNGNSASMRCCVPSWSCGSTPPTCSDGSNPGEYITITASYPFASMFAQGSFLNGRTLVSSVTARIQ